MGRKEDSLANSSLPPVEEQDSSVWRVAGASTGRTNLLPPASTCHPCLDGEGLAGWEFSLSTDEGL